MTRFAAGFLALTALAACAPESEVDLDDGPEAQRLIYDANTGVVVRAAPGMDLGLDEDGNLVIVVQPPSDPPLFDPQQRLPSTGLGTVYMGSDDAKWLLDAAATWIDDDSGVLVAEGADGLLVEWPIE